MTIPIPVGMQLGTVTWRLGHTTQAAMLKGARGLVRFEPTAVAVSYPDTTVLPSSVTARVQGGQMEPVDLTVNDPEIWNWRVIPEFGRAWTPFHIDVPVEGVDLATAAAVPGKGPVRAVKGPQGAQGVSIAGVSQTDEETLEITLTDPATGGTEIGTYQLPRGPEGPFGGTAVTDPQVASYVTTATATKVALDQSYVRGVNVIAHGAVGDGVADDRAAIQAAIDLGASLGVDVILPAGHTFRTTSHLTVSAPVRIDGRGATLRAEGTATAVVISSSYVTIEGLSIVGNGAGVFAGANRGILSMGTAAAPFTAVHLIDVSVSAMTDTAIRCDWWTDSSITGGRLSDLAYAGIIAQSAQRLRIDGVAVEDVWQHDADQSYGISITDSVNTVEGRSRDVTVNGCTVSNVAHWTGLSTHGGERVSFTNNRIVGCYRGIIYGAGNPTRVVAATDGLVTGNIIDGTGSGSSTGLGVIGQTGGLQSTALRSANLVRNHARLFEASTNGVWFDDAQVLGSDSGFPVAKAGIGTTEEVIDRITVPPSTFVRRVSVVASVYAVSTLAANRCDIRVYAGSTNIGTTRRALSGSSLPESIPGVGSAEIPASTTPTVIEVRAVLNSGTGTMTTSAAGGLTTSTVTVARV